LVFVNPGVVHYIHYSAGEDDRRRGRREEEEGGGEVHLL
jgi:hypothetical protein